MSADGLRSYCSLSTDMLRLWILETAGNVMVRSITEAGTITMRSLASAASPSHDAALIFNFDAVAAVLKKPIGC